MDAYCLVRFIYLCLRICLFASFWGMLVLTPIYAFGDGEASGIYYLTLANVAQSSNKFVRTYNYLIPITGGVGVWVIKKQDEAGVCRERPQQPLEVA